MDRRAFIGALGLLAAARAAGAQSPSAKMARIGYVSIRSSPSHLDEAFRQGLRELGYVEGQNISVEYRWADWKLDRASAFAADLVRLKVDLIVATGGNALVVAVKKAVKSTPVVFSSSDPVRVGIVPRLDRPGGSLTGVNLLTTELNMKRLEILTASVPGVSRVAVLVDPSVPIVASLVRDVQDAARSLRVNIQVVEARNAREIDQAFAAMARERAGALLVLAHPLFLTEREHIVTLAAKSRLPGIYEQREFAEAGGLLSYGANFADMYRRLATYVDKILKGVKPGDLPVEQPSKFELVINLKTAKALGLTIPPALLQRADQVIE